MYIRRKTTPTLTFTTTLTQMDSASVAFSQNEKGVLIVKKNVTIVTDETTGYKSVRCTLTSDETLRLIAGYACYAQLTVLIGGTISTSDLVQLDVYDSLDEYTPSAAEE